MAAILELRKVTAGYRGVPVLRGIDIEVHPGEVVGLMGRNGAGKSTTLRTIAGIIRPSEGQVYWNGQRADSSLYRRARRGLAYVSEERSVFMGLTAADNLKVAAVRPEEVLGFFPELQAHMKRKAGLLSGGQQQMLTLGRALARQPKALLADELSLGLAPMLVRRLLAAARRAAEKGVGVLIVEQRIGAALAVCDRAYVLQRGRVVLAGTAEEIRRSHDEIERQYLTGNDPGAGMG